MSVHELSVYEMSVDEVSADETSTSKMTYCLLLDIKKMKQPANGFSMT